MEPWDAVVSIARDLTDSLGTEDRYRRLVEAVRKTLPCDAAALLEFETDRLVPLASHGLTPEATRRPYHLKNHPRLSVICAAEAPVIFPPDSPLPDPFDGLLADDARGLAHVHACLGIPLRVEGELVGALTADAREPHAFDGIDPRFFAFLGALAGAALRTSRLLAALERTAVHLGLVTRDLVRDAHQRGGGELIGTSPAMNRLREEIDLVARSDFAVLITGETGTGKELVARAIHARSARKDAPLIYVNGAALPESIAESELFGHLRGAFTGADRDRPGKFEVADGGTLFLDEIGELPLGVQPKLLRALQEGEIQRIGADRTHRVSVRVLAATNRDLEREVAAGRFRADLFHRLCVYPIAVAPLRERKGDLPLLAGYFCDLARRRLGLTLVRLAPEARDALAGYGWPGNVRELENVVSRAVLRAAAERAPGEPVLLEPVHLGHDFEAGGSLPAGADAPLPAAEGPGASLREELDEYRRRRIRQAVARHGGNWAAAARSLGLHRSNLYHLAHRLGLR